MHGQQNIKKPTLCYLTFKRLTNKSLSWLITSLKFELIFPLLVLHNRQTVNKERYCPAFKERQFSGSPTIVMILNDRFITLITPIITAEVKDSEREFPQLCL